MLDTAQVLDKKEMKVYFGQKIMKYADEVKFTRSKTAIVAIIQIMIGLDHTAQNGLKTIHHIVICREDITPGIVQVLQKV